MNKVQLKDERDIKWEKFMRYMDLVFRYWNIQNTLRREYPEKMAESSKRSAEIWLDRGLVKCKHER